MVFEVWVQDEKIQIFKVLSARDFFYKIELKCQIKELSIKLSRLSKIWGMIIIGNVLDFLPWLLLKTHPSMI